MTDGLELPADPAAIRDEQLERALERLDDREGLTPGQRAAAERLADRLTAELLGMFVGATAPSLDAGEAECERPPCPD